MRTQMMNKMKHLPIINKELWKYHSRYYKIYRIRHNYGSEELFTFNAHEIGLHTRHSMAKGPTMIEGIRIVWEGNPFNLPL
jgi:hypothetical protein